MCLILFQMICDFLIPLSSKFICFVYNIHDSFFKKVLKIRNFYFLQRMNSSLFVFLRNFKDGDDYEEQNNKQPFSH